MPPANAPIPAHLPPRRSAVRVLRELTTLLKGHVPVDKALALAAAQQRDPRARQAALALGQAVRRGELLSQALAAQADYFGTTAAAAAHAGESAGALPEVLSSLVDHLERQAKLRRKIAAALIYPAVVLCVATAAVTLLLTVIVPRMLSLFESITSGSAQLPWPTRALMAAADMAQGPPGMLALAIVCGVPILLLLFPRLRADLHPLALRLPLLGDVVRKGAQARAFGTLAILLRAGVPLPEALPLAGSASGSPPLAARFDHLRMRLVAGTPLSTALRGRDRLLPPSAAEVAAVGEETGTLPEQLAWLASELETQAAARSALLATLIEPALMIGLALVVGFIVAALYMPVLTLIDTLGQ